MSRMRKFLTATFLVCCAVGSTTVSASPVLKTTAPAAASQASYQQKAAMLPGVSGTFTEQEASAATVSRPAVITRSTRNPMTTAPRSMNPKMESKVARIGSLTPTSPITPSTSLPSIIPSQPSTGSSVSDAYAIRDDFGKSNLRKWSSAEGHAGAFGTRRRQYHHEHLRPCATGDRQESRCSSRKYARETRLKTKNSAPVTKWTPFDGWSGFSLKK